MSFRLDNIFKPLTSNWPQDTGYVEIAPCDALKPYVRCFWISSNKFNLKENTVIPDVCMDIILTFDGNKIYSGFCGINDKAFLSVPDNCLKFGIRFYAWSAILFSDIPMNNALNIFSDTKEYFFDFNNSVTEEIILSEDVFKMKTVAEKYLVSRLRSDRMNDNVMNSLYKIISSNGKVKIGDLSDFCVVSRRQLERIFLEYTGISPKKMTNLIRYQLLWQESLKNGFNIFDCVEKFGYYDQAHLLNEFKKYHSMPLSKAKKHFQMSLFSNTN